MFFLFFLLFNHDLIRCVDFTRISASNTASTHRIFNADLSYSCAHLQS